MGWIKIMHFPVVASPLPTPAKLENSEAKIWNAVGEHILFFLGVCYLGLYSANTSNVRKFRGQMSNAAGNIYCFSFKCVT